MLIFHCAGLPTKGTPPPSTLTAPTFSGTSSGETLYFSVVETYKDCPVCVSARSFRPTEVSFKSNISREGSHWSMASRRQRLSTLEGPELGPMFALDML